LILFSLPFFLTCTKTVLLLGLTVFAGKHTVSEIYTANFAIWRTQERYLLSAPAPELPRPPLWLVKTVKIGSPQKGGPAVEIEFNEYTPK